MGLQSHQQMSLWKLTLNMHLLKSLLLWRERAIKQCLKEHSAVNGMSLSNPSPHALGTYLCGRGGGTFRARGGGPLQGNSVFQTQQAGHTAELIKTGATCTRPEQVQTRHNICTEEGELTQSPNPTQGGTCDQYQLPKGYEFSPMESPGIPTTLQGRPAPASS